MSLALWRRADVEVGVSVLVEPQLRGLAAPEPCRLDAARDAQPDQAAVVGPLGHTTDLFHGQLQELRIVAAVVHKSTAAAGIARRERDLLRLDEVAAPQLDRRELQRSRQLVDHPLHRVVA